MLACSERREKPNVILSIFPAFFVFYSGKTPYVWLFDTTFLGQEDYWPSYGKLPLMISTWQERRAFAHAARLITKSEWSKNVLIQQYGVPASRIDVIPSYAILPAGLIPEKILPAQEKNLASPLRLLLVGRVYSRKGIDIAIEVVKQLNAQGIPTQLTICGLNHREVSTPPFVQFVGPYRKSDSAQIQKYVEWYKWAHLLLHPARFEAAGIVPSEAAAFGTPTITNDVGGLATTVKHGESGIVLPCKSPPEAYVQAICELVSQPERYYDLCQSTRRRYERELNSAVSGNRLAGILRDVVSKSS
jgi:glycosyltransferase involved in cell wall biosynthesis